MTNDRARESAGGSLFAEHLFDDRAFTDGKAPDALRTIGEVARALNIKSHVLRYWEEQFPMLRPLKRSGDRRYYRRTDVALLERIDRLINREGYTLKGARQVIEAEIGNPPVARRPEPAAGPAGTGEVLPRLRALRDRLASSLEAA